jgi:hypothetical protein
VKVNMQIEKGTQVLWFDAVGRTPIRIGIPIELTAPEAKAALEEFVSFLAQLAVLPNADMVTLGEAYTRLSEQGNKWN